MLLRRCANWGSRHAATAAAVALSKFGVFKGPRLMISRCLSQSTNSTTTSSPSPEDGKLIKFGPNEKSDNSSSSSTSTSPPCTSSDIVIDVEMDTAAAVKNLTATGLTVEQSEVIVDLTRWIIFVRLEEMARISVSRSQMDHDCTMLKAMFEEIQTALSAVSVRNRIEIQSTHDRLSTELTTLLDHLRDLTSSLRTELILAVDIFKAEGRENAQKTDMSVHRVDGKLMVDMSGFKTNLENVKLKAIYTFTMVLCGLFMAIVAEKSLPKRSAKGHQSPKQAGEESSSMVEPPSWT